MLLVLNCGSLSIKFKLFSGSRLDLVKEGRKGFSRVVKTNVYQKELRKILGSLKNFPIKAVGHRVVHGGPKYRKPTAVTPAALDEIKKYSSLAPLHNPFNLAGIKTAQALYDVPQIACFDTEFFGSLPDKASFYALPYRLYERHSIRRFGFHGLSHEYVVQEAAKILKKPLRSLNLITCHLGGGSSITAIKRGKPVDTSMGLTPLEGLVMMTRPGDLDAGILFYLAEKFSFKKLNNLLNFSSGLKGLSGLPANMRKIVAEAKKGNPRARLALEVYAYRIQKYIGAYLGILGHCDALVFTGAIGHRGSEIRKAITKNFNILKNISMLVIQTNEELLIAQKIKKNFPDLI